MHLNNGVHEWSSFNAPDLFRRALSAADCLRYDKGETNGAPFVYYSAELMAAGGAEDGALMDYACTVLDALGWR